MYLEEQIEKEVKKIIDKISASAPVYEFCKNCPHCVPNWHRKDKMGFVCEPNDILISWEDNKENIFPPGYKHGCTLRRERVYQSKTEIHKHIGIALELCKYYGYHIEFDTGIDDGDWATPESTIQQELPKNYKEYFIYG